MVLTMELKLTKPLLMKPWASIGSTAKGTRAERSFLKSSSSKDVESQVVSAESS